MLKLRVILNNKQQTLERLLSKFHLLEEIDIFPLKEGDAINSSNIVNNTRFHRMKRIRLGVRVSIWLKL